VDVLTRDDDEPLQSGGVQERSFVASSSDFPSLQSAVNKAPSLNKGLPTSSPALDFPPLQGAVLRAPQARSTSPSFWDSPTGLAKAQAASPPLRSPQLPPGSPSSWESPPAVRSWVDASTTRALLGHRQPAVVAQGDGGNRVSTMAQPALQPNVSDTRAPVQVQGVPPGHGPDRLELDQRAQAAIEKVLTTDEGKVGPWGVCVCRETNQATTDLAAD
jgi:hypothetical protein